MTTGLDALNAAIAAARAGDVDTVRRLIDWPLTGAAEAARGVPMVNERDRPGIVDSGLGELDGAANDPDLVDDILEPVMRHLESARGIALAPPAAAEAVREALRVPPVPAGLTADQYGRFAQLGECIAAIREVYLVSGDNTDLPVAVAPDTGLLVLVLVDQ